MSNALMRLRDRLIKENQAMSAPQTARERFEAWYFPKFKDDAEFDEGLAWESWQAAERSMNEQAAKEMDSLAHCEMCADETAAGRRAAEPYVRAARVIRSLIT